MSIQFKSIAFAAALATLAGAAHAQTVDRVDQTQSVSYADLNLSSQAGMNTLMARIDGAAKTVCGSAPDVREMDRRYSACLKAATAAALAEVTRTSGSSHLAVNLQRQHGG
jgi:UrcA family protein